MSRTILRRRIITAALVIGAVLIAVWIWYSNALRAAGGEEQLVTVKEGATIAQIAEDLEGRKLIKSSRVFRYHVGRADLGKEVKAGRYRIDGQKSAPEIARALAAGPQPGASQFTVKEGQTQATIASTLARLGGVNRDEFAELKTSDFTRYEFLRGLPKDATLEGFLFPDTYELPPPESTTAEVATVLLNQFDKELTAEMREQIQDSGRSLFDTVIIASIVEVEVRSNADRRLVAGIFYRRLREDIRLDADATLRYGIDKPTGALTKDDLASNDPYNSRKRKGLPPGPISNPGLSSLRAAINPQESEFLFYLSAPDGRTIFSKDLEEHEANVERYLR